MSLIAFYLLAVIVFLLGFLLLDYLERKTLSEEELAQKTALSFLIPLSGAFLNSGGRLLFIVGVVAYFVYRLTFRDGIREKFVYFQINRLGEVCWDYGQLKFDFLPAHVQTEIRKIAKHSEKGFIVESSLLWPLKFTKVYLIKETWDGKGFSYSLKRDAKIEERISSLLKEIL